MLLDTGNKKYFTTGLIRTLIFSITRHGNMYLHVKSRFRASYFIYEADPYLEGKKINPDYISKITQCDRKTMTLKDINHNVVYGDFKYVNGEFIPINKIYTINLADSIINTRIKPVIHERYPYRLIEIFKMLQEVGWNIGLLSMHLTIKFDQEPALECDCFTYEGAYEPNTHAYMDKIVITITPKLSRLSDNDTKIDKLYEIFKDLDKMPTSYDTKSLKLLIDK